MPPIEPQPTGRRILRILPALSLAVLMLGAYYPALDAGFIWDDDKHFVDDKLITAPDGLYRIWFSPDQAVWNYWPLSRTSFWIEHHLWGFNAAASHATNIVLHLAGVLILYFGLRRFRVPSAWFIAALFALHPLFVESVTWITERKNVLSGIFYLTGIYSYLVFDENRKGRYYALSLLLFLGCLLSKSSTIMLPVILIFCRVALDRPWLRRDILLLTPFFLLSLLSAAASIHFEHNFVGSRGPEFDRDLSARIATAGRIPFFYLGKILFPYPLLFNYPKWDINPASFQAWIPLASGALAAVFLLRKLCTRWGRTLALGLGAYLATLLPILGFFDIYGMRYTFVADHWAYLPALPILLLVGLGLGALLRKSNAIRWTAFTLILFACGLLTWSHNKIFHDPETLWVATIERNPDSWLAHSNLATLRGNSGRLQEAMDHLLITQRLAPQFENLHVNMGSILHQQGKTNEAIEHYRRQLTSNPNHFLAHYNLGIALLAQRDYLKAAHHFDLAVQIDPADSNARLNLGATLYELGKADEAIAQYLAALQIDPKNAAAHANLGTALYHKKDIARAAQHLEEALRLVPNLHGSRDLLNQLRSPKEE